METSPDKDEGEAVVRIRNEGNSGDEDGIEHHGRDGSSEAPMRVTMTFPVTHDATVQDLQLLIEVKELISPEAQTLTFKQMTLKPANTLRSYTIQNGDTVHMRVLQPRRLRKPVIYIFPPTFMPLVDVSVVLAPQWRFTHIYPLADTKVSADTGKQCVAWSVSAQPDGTLLERSSGLELSYLFWEAEAHHAPSSPPSSPTLAAQPPIEHFDPTAPALDPTSPTAVCLPTAELLPYLDAALKRLTLHVAARTDFITYWLPRLSRAPFVALRFVAQAAYARAAELHVAPAPDVVTRVFVLFRGVREDEAEAWAAARERAADGSVDWVEVVGVQAAATDPAAFRVLEWGAMEVQ
ncbi:ubiquitin-domain-containing protein [Epithele typhae]|uniref:ubiquitin-domain-containing protein n=1 Tax=Epithele typhae TaxID=378194 RepID=UPI00200753E0|nr:ubiquitin-domain-containing protein [Epithele typhae]KAH9944995.1 ubiquitin-domain-containing protein [Epithele typhae]